LCGVAAVLADLGRMEEAKSAYDGVLQRNSTSDIALNGKAYVLKEQGHYSEALALFEKTISTHPGKPHGTLGKANVLREMRKHEDALELLSRARRSFPNEPMVLIETAEVLRGQKKLDDALKMYQQALERFPSHSRVGNGRANILKERGEFTEALRAYDQNISKFPYDISSRHGRADLLKKLRDFNSAIAAYDEIALRWPEKSFDAQQRKAAILVALEKYSDAEKLLPTTPPRTAEEWIASHVRGMILLKTNRLTEAIAHFENGLASVPYARNKKYFKNALAVAFLRQKEFSKASNVLPEATELVTNVLQLHAWAGEGKKDRASRMLQFVERSPMAQVIELSREIARRFGVRSERPRHDENWIHTMECDLVLLEAA